MPLLAVLGVMWVLSLAYVAWIHCCAARERATRRAAGGLRIAVRAWPPAGSPSEAPRDEARRLGRWFAGLATDRPRVLPLIAAIIAGVGAVFVLIDPLLDEPILWAASTGGASTFFPTPVRVAIGGMIVLAAVIHVVWVFLTAPLVLSWEKLVLMPDGRVGLEGCAMPGIDPVRAIFGSLSIPSRHGAPAMGMTLQQGRLHYAFDYLGIPGGNRLGPVPAVPRDWWHLVLEGEVALVDAFLKHHYGPGSAPFARITPMPDDDSSEPPPRARGR